MPDMGSFPHVEGSFRINSANAKYGASQAKLPAKSQLTSGRWKIAHFSISCGDSVETDSYKPDPLTHPQPMLRRPAIS